MVIPEERTFLAWRQTSALDFFLSHFFPHSIGGVAILATTWRPNGDQKGVILWRDM